MAKFAMLNAYVKINNVDLSDHVTECNVNMEADDVDVTGMGQYAKDHIHGLKDESFEITFLSDFAAASVDATLAPLYTGGTPFPVEVAPNGSTFSSTNPKYSGSCIMLSYSPISGAVGDAATTQVTFPCKGTITRSTS